MEKSRKTNAERILDQNNINYIATSYTLTDGKIDGISVADKIGKSQDVVFKTLVTQGQSGAIYVLVVPVSCVLDMKKVARICGEKKIEMIRVGDIERHTGYIRGGCSPIGMKKKYKTFIHNSVEDAKEVIVSAGKIGAQLTLNPKDLVRITEGEFADIVRK